MGTMEALIIFMELITVAAIVSVLQQRDLPGSTRIMWVVVVLIGNVVGALAWFIYLITRGRARRLGSHN